MFLGAICSLSIAYPAVSDSPSVRRILLPPHLVQRRPKWSPLTARKRATMATPPTPIQTRGDAATALRADAGAAGDGEVGGAVDDGAEPHNVIEYAGVGANVVRDAMRLK